MIGKIAIHVGALAIAAVGAPAVIVAAGAAVALGVGAKAIADNEAKKRQLKQQNYTRYGR